MKRNQMISLFLAAACLWAGGFAAAADYLFIEAGGFSERNPAGWQSPWCVMKRQIR